MRICPFIENFHCHAWSGNVNNGENSSFLRIYVTKDNAISEPTWNLDINTVLFILFLKETIEMIILISWISLWQTLLNLCLLLGLSHLAALCKIRPHICESTIKKHFYAIIFNIYHANTIIHPKTLIPRIKKCLA